MKAADDRPRALAYLILWKNRAEHHFDPAKAESSEHYGSFV